MQFLLKFCGAGAVAAGPEFGAVLVTAFAAVMSILHSGEIEIRFPVGTFFLQWGWAVADFDPARSLIFAETRFVHVSEIFSLRDGALAQRFALDSLQQVAFTAGFNAGSDEISHGQFDV